jgi:hypothetical protein
MLGLTRELQPISDLEAKYRQDLIVPQKQKRNAIVKGKLTMQDLILMQTLNN